MDKFSKIDVNKLEKEAEGGHGHYVGSILDQLPFEEQLHVAHEIANLSKERSAVTGCPRIEFCMEALCGDTNSANGYSNIQLYRETHRRYLRLLPKEELIYESSLNLTTGEKAAADNNQ